MPVTSQSVVIKSDAQILELMFETLGGKYVMVRKPASAHFIDVKFSTHIKSG
ncbi:hypothetical protein [Moorena producens]|uniref:hypothetical protein n=1 Tax=Moorena producens TaxID=1155739 RepID=UPI001313D808|nr:hypothetical protein [Moorena producens]